MFGSIANELVSKKQRRKLAAGLIAGAVGGLTTRRGRKNVSRGVNNAARAVGLKKKKKRRNRQRQLSPFERFIGSLSESGRVWVDALSRPYDRSIRLTPLYEHYDHRPSTIRPFCSYARGSFASNIHDGFWYIMVALERTMTSDSSSIIFNDDEDTHEGLETFSTAGTNTTVNSPYVDADFGVGDTNDEGLYGSNYLTLLRIKYAGTELNRGGRFVGCLRESGGRSLQGINVTEAGTNIWQSKQFTFTDTSGWVNILALGNHNQDTDPSAQDFRMGFIGTDASSTEATIIQYEVYSFNGVHGTPSMHGNVTYIPDFRLTVPAFAVMCQSKDVIYEGDTPHALLSQVTEAFHETNVPLL